MNKFQKFCWFFVGYDAAMTAWNLSNESHWWAAVVFGCGLLMLWFARLDEKATA